MSKSWMIAFNYMKKLNMDVTDTPDTNVCPNTPECNVVTCECGDKYCTTSGHHVCIIGGKEYSRPYLYVSVEDTGIGYDIQHSKLKRYNFTDKCWEDFETNPVFDLILYNSKTKLKTGMYTYKKLSKVDMGTVVLKEDLGEYVCSNKEAPPRS